MEGIWKHLRQCFSNSFLLSTFPKSSLSLFVEESPTFGRILFGEIL